jgi:6,7-dimethyl-8-ribityllumazine synthase
LNDTPVRVGIVVGQFHRDIANGMLQAAKDQIRQSGAILADTAWVPGSYEAPLVAKHLLKQASIDVVVVLGLIHKGETLHGDVMGRVVHQSLVDLSLQYEKPIGMGIIGPGATLEQAQVRHSTYARDAVRAALFQHRTLHQRPTDH